MVNTRNVASPTKTIEEQDISSPVKLGKRAKVGSSVGSQDSQNSASAQRYWHDAFLRDSFQQYKELLLSMTTEQSTSADSKRHKSAEKQDPQGQVIDNPDHKSDGISKVDASERVGANGTKR